MAEQHDKQFKLDAVQYYQDHKDLGVRMCRKSWHRIQHINKMAGKTSENQVIFLFVVLVIMHLMSRRKLPVSDVNYVMPKMHLMC